MFQIEKDSNGIVTLSISRKDKPMNVVDRLFLDQLIEKWKEVEQTPGLRGVFITSSNPEFVAGADLGVFEKGDRPAIKSLIDDMHMIYRKIEKSPVPVVAGINGACLGGGYELALSCHYRIALDSPKTQIGLPEVSLGLLPGAGGTQRLPRLIGYQKAIPLITQGQRLNPGQAKENGLVDLVVADRDQMVAQAKDWILKNPQAKQPWDDEKFKLPGGEIQSPKAAQFFAGANAMTREKTMGNYPAPRFILSCIYEGLQLPIERALELEKKYFCELAAHPSARAQIRTLFFGVNACNKGAARPAGIPKKIPKKIGILGAGMMGSGIAYASARAGMDVVLKDVSKEVAEKGKSYSTALLEKELSRGKLTAVVKDETLARIQATDEAKALAGCDLVIEAVIEDRGIKAKVTAETEEVISENSIFGSNTSTLPITGLAEKSKRPGNFIGVHFFSPVEKMQLVEIIMGKQTSDATLAAAIDYVQALKKTPIVVNDGRGFYTSRIFTKYVEEGMLCLHDGISPALIENAGKMAGMAVGPLCVADEVSLDLVYHVLKQTKEDLGPQAVNPHMDEMTNLFVEKLRRLGRKVGHGFYEYPKDGKKFLWPELSKHFARRPDRDDVEEVKKRLLYRQSLETIRCLEEKILRSARDADVGSIFGWGFPAYTGGTLSFVEYVGIEKFLRESQRLFETYGERFRPPALLVEKAKSGASFHDE
jgi:3-hydroxyacyl-CoA dehydrogenase/enoyl-CoA hydratase/3-hydroxybutyryl-CoA epimerase